MTAPNPETAPPAAPAEALAARPLLEQVAAMSDCIGAQTVGSIMAISDRAAAWLRDNPPGQPVAVEPRGCPTPGACSCVEPAPPAAPAGGLVERVEARAGGDGRAAIREVAAWLNERDTSIQNDPDAALEAPSTDDAIRWLREETDR